MKRLPTRRELERAFDVDVERGEVFLRSQSGKGHRRSRIGTRVGWIKKRTRGGVERQIDFHVSGERFRIPEHWLIWFWVHDLWPDYPREVIDHADGNALNNAISNLRICTIGENTRNSKLRKTNETGYKWVQRHGDGYSFRMSGYKTAEDAYRAACKAARELHGEFFNDGQNDPDGIEEE